MSKEDRATGLMRLAIVEAEHGLGRTSPNPAVGCVIACGDRVVGRGFHARVGAPHAEAVALASAGAHARGADAYVTLEPCDHYGRTPPCSKALIEAGVRRVFVGARDPNPIVNSRGMRRLRKAGIEVVTGVLTDECRALNTPYEHAFETGRPYVLAKWAMSLDGKIADATGHSRWVTSEPARELGHRLRNQLDVILVGVGTVLADNPKLTCRVPGGRDPVRIVADSQARTPPGARVVRMAKGSTAPTLIAVTAGAPAKRRAALERAGAQVLECRANQGRVDIRDLLRHVRELGWLSVLVEGGPTVMAGFLQARLIDVVYAFVAPKVIGGAGAKGAVGGERVFALRDALALDFVAMQQLGPDLLIVGKPSHRP